MTSIDGSVVRKGLVVMDQEVDNQAVLTIAVVGSNSNCVLDLRYAS